MSIDVTIDAEYFGMHTQKILKEIKLKYWRLGMPGFFASFRNKPQMNGNLRNSIIM
jgi:hypothetical protein